MTPRHQHLTHHQPGGAGAQPPSSVTGPAPTWRPSAPGDIRKTCSLGGPRDGRRVSAVAPVRPSGVAEPGDGLFNPALYGWRRQ
jgi:hypothetical protein